jgi:hypothetical protein
MVHYSFPDDSGSDLHAAGSECWTSWRLYNILSFLDQNVPRNSAKWKLQKQLHKLIVAIDGFTARVRLEMASCFAICLLLLLLPERVSRGGLESADLRLQCSSRSPQIWTSERDGPTVGHVAAPHWDPPPHCLGVGPTVSRLPAPHCFPNPPQRAFWSQKSDQNK